MSCGCDVDACFCRLSFCCAEFAVVLQLDRPVEPAVAGAQQHVPAAVDGLQAARRRRLGRAGRNVPACDPGAASDAVRRIGRPLPPEQVSSPLIGLLFVLIPIRVPTLTISESVAVRICIKNVAVPSQPHTLIVSLLLHPCVGAPFAPLVVVTSPLLHLHFTTAPRPLIESCPALNEVHTYVLYLVASCLCLIYSIQPAARIQPGILLRSVVFNLRAAFTSPHGSVAVSIVALFAFQSLDFALCMSVCRCPDPYQSLQPLPLSS